MPRLLVAFAALAIALLGRAALTSSFGHDEIEHAHVTWQVTQGLDPYVAFHQNHTPTIWLIAAPILELMPVDVRALIALRCLSLASIFVIAIMVVKVTRRLHAGHTRLVELELWAMIATFVVAYALGAYRFRPDPPMAAFVAIAGGLLISYERPRWPIAIAVGLALGMAATLTLKVWPIGLAVGVVAWLTLRRHGRGAALRLIVGVGLGFMLPLLAVVAWLASRDLVAPFIEDVLAFNARYRQGWGIVDTLLDLRIGCLAFVGLAVSFVRSDHALHVARLWFVGGLGAMVLAAHPSRYMLLAAMFGLVLMLGEVVRWAMDQPAWAWRKWSLPGVLVRFAVLAAVLGWVRSDLWELALKGSAERHATPATLDAMIALVREHEGAQCFALAPVHPVFCHDAVPLAIGWDLTFLAHPTPRFRERQERLWRAGMERLIEAPPELVFVGAEAPAIHDERLDAQARARLAEVWRTRYDSIALSPDVGVLVRRQ